MSTIVLVVLLVLFIWALASGSTIIRHLAKGLAVVIALAAAAAGFGLIAVGQKAHWTSDGPGMLLIMIGIPICGIITWSFAMLAFTPTTSAEDLSLEDPSRLHSLAQAWERYKELTKRPQ